ncbi:MAG: flagellar basal body P-ring formation chaperone FlgA, partial [Rickettsiales bacterium]
IKFIIACASISLLICPASSIANDAASSEAYIFNIYYEDAQDAISKTLTEKLSSEHSDSKKVAAIINNRTLTPLYSSNEPINVEIRGLRTDNTNNRWNASIIIMANDNKVLSAMPIAGRFMMMSEVPVLKHPFRNGEIIRESDIEIKSFPQKRIHNDTVANIEDLVGKTPIRTISYNRPIRSTEISTPAIIEKNALIQIRYKTANMEITTTGKALEDGAKGDVIEVLNTTSKKTTRAMVTSSNIVDVLAQAVQTSQIIPQTTSIANQIKVQ